MSSREIEAAAAAWLARQDAGSLGEAEQKAFGAWLDSSTAHRVAYIRLRAAWNFAVRGEPFSASRVDRRRLD